MSEANKSLGRMVSVASSLNTSVLTITDRARPAPEVFYIPKEDVLEIFKALKASDTVLEKWTELASNEVLLVVTPEPIEYERVTDHLLDVFRQAIQLHRGGERNN